MLRLDDDADTAARQDLLDLILPGDDLTDFERRFHTTTSAWSLALPDARICVLLALRARGQGRSRQGGKDRRDERKLRRGTNPRFALTISSGTAVRKRPRPRLVEVQRSVAMRRVSRGHPAKARTCHGLAETRVCGRPHA